MSRWLGIDVGTSSLKALVVDDVGVVIARAVAEYDSASPVADGIGEQEPETWIRAAREAIAACIQTAGQPDGVGLTGQVPTLVLVGRDGIPARPAMTWQDTRATAQADALAAELGPSEPLLGMDLPWSAAHLPAKLRWLAEHEPGLLGDGVLALQPKDFLGMRLTGSPASDLWSLKGLVDIRTGGLQPAVLAATGWASDVYPPIAQPWEARGATGADALGLAPGIPVAVGWSDALASMLAIGAFAEPRAFVLTGTSDIVGVSVDADIAERPGLYRVPHECAPRVVLYGPTQSSGATVAWLARVFERSVDELFDHAARTTRDSSATFVPYISGERSPIWRPDVRGMFAGLDAADGAPELIHAGLSGVALSARHILDEVVESTGQPVTEVHVGGRGVDDVAWRDLRLETLGVPVLFHPEPFMAALGAAMLGATAAGSDLASAVRLAAAPVRVEPTAAQVATSQEAAMRYRSVSDLAQRWASA